MLNIVLGVCLLCIGIIGLARNWWAVLDFVGVIVPVLLVVIGVLTVLAGLTSWKKRRPE